MNYMLIPGDDTLPEFPQEIIDALKSQFYDQGIYFNEVHYYDAEDVDKPEFMHVQPGPFEILAQNAVVVNASVTERTFNLLKKFRRDHLPPPEPIPEPTPPTAKKK